MSSSWYKFRYIDTKGLKRSKSIKAKSLRSAKQYIISKEYELINIRKVYQIEHLLEKFKKKRIYKLLFQPKLTRYEVYWLTKELYGFLESGLPLLDSLIALKGFSTSKRYQKILNVIINGIRENKSTELRGFGRFSTKIIKEKRNARNPRTGEKIHIEARKYISFKMAKELKEKINKNRFINWKKIFLLL